MNFFALRVGDIHTENILRILQHEAHVDLSITKLRNVTDAYRVIGSCMHRDVHRAVLQVHLLMAARTGLAVRGPTIADFLRSFLRFIAVKFILKDEFAVILRIGGRKVDEREGG